MKYNSETRAVIHAGAGTKIKGTSRAESKAWP